jgi:hypothetical protein
MTKATSSIPAPRARTISLQFVLFTILLSLLAAPAVAVLSFLVWAP